MNIFTIIGCAIGYLFAKCLTNYRETTFADACIVAVFVVLINAVLDGLWDGAITDYHSSVVGVLLGYAALRLYERNRP